MKLALTNEQRLEILKETKIIIKKSTIDEEACICLTLKDCTLSLLYKQSIPCSELININTAHQIFPELLKHKPKNRNVIRSWWSYSKRGQTKRLKVIDELITEIKKQL